MKAVAQTLCPGGNAMKYLSLLTVLLFSVAMQAQGLSNVSAELSKKIDTKNAHVGDAVEARTTNAVTLPDGTQLPKGTKLAGKVTDVHAKSSADKTSHVAFTLDRAILRDGREVPIHTTLAALSVPSVAAETAANEVSADAGTPAMRGAGGGTPTAYLSGGASRSAVTVPDATNKAIGNAVTGTGLPMGSAPPSTAAPETNATVGPHLDHVAVAHLPGVTFSSAILGKETGSLDATGQNISVEGGTQMTLVLRAPQP